MVGWV